MLSERAQKVLLPGLACLGASALIEKLLMLAGVWPKIVFLSESSFVQFQWLWLASLPLCGALGAYLARQAGATINQRVVAALFPVITLFTLLVLAAAAGSVVNIMRGTLHPKLMFESMGGFMLGEMLFPAAFLIAGAAPFLRAEAKTPVTSEI